MTTPVKNSVLAGIVAGRSETSIAPAAALAVLRESRDAGHDAPIWHNDGRSVAALAQAAGVRVEYVHVNLATWRVERRIVDGREGVSE